MIRVLSVEDHVIVRNGLKQLFGVLGGITMAGEAANGEEALEVLRQDRFDLVLLDLTMPGLGGIKLVNSIRAQAQDVPILIYSMHDELQTAKQALQAGASGYVAKGSGQDTLISAIRKVAAGGRFVDPVIAEQMAFERPGNSGSAPHSSLSERERQVMKHLAKGMRITEIAETYFISSKTVSTHKLRLMHKMNFGNNADLVRYAVDNNLID